MNVHAGVPVRTSMIAQRDHPGPAARMVFASICGYLAIALSSRQRHQILIVAAQASIGSQNC